MKRGDKGWIKHPYPWLWVVMFREHKHEDFHIHSEYHARINAVQECHALKREWVGRGNAYVQKYGPTR